ncbi:hypothetical protein B0H19DRAFT_1263694 [Mycena capillaripes]|nr:hypothetical protein B0H19DRAFT_1263694 [Mycena capillaripes]
MSFISNAAHVTLGDGVYNNVSGDLNIIHHTFCGTQRKRGRNEIDDTPDSLHISGAPARKRRRRDEDTKDGIEIIQTKHLKLALEIGSGHGYFLHAGQIKGQAVIIKVFNEGPTVRELKSTVALSKNLLHPNVLRLEGVSSPTPSTQFIAYEHAHWKTAEGPLAAALKDNLAKSITLGFKMTRIAGLSAGMNYLGVQGISMATLEEESFDIFLDINDRFLISINPRMPADSSDVSDRQEEDNAIRSWNVFNALCQKVLRSANHDDIERVPAMIDVPRAHSVPQNVFPSASPSPASSVSFVGPRPQDLSKPEPSTIPPRREYVWRTLDRGQQSLATVASRISRDLDLNRSSSVNTLTLTNGQSPHRCAGYVREEITLTTTTLESAVVSHDAPSPLEICSICREVVGFAEAFRCVCGDANPGSRPTLKCSEF